MQQNESWIARNKNKIIRGIFLIPILLVAVISISHVITWYDMANPIKWAVFLSIAIEVGAMVSLAASTVKIKGAAVWIVFGIVTLIQFIGNIFYSYTEIDVLSTMFQQWVELVGPVFELLGTETTDIIGHKRWLAFLEGGLLPIISLASLHFFVKFGEQGDDSVKVETPEGKTPPEPIELEDTPTEEVYPEINPEIDDNLPDTEKDNPEISDEPETIRDILDNERKGIQYEDLPEAKSRKDFSVDVTPKREKGKTRVVRLGSNKTTKGDGKVIFNRIKNEK